MDTNKTIKINIQNESNPVDLGEKAVAQEVMTENAKKEQFVLQEKPIIQVATKDDAEEIVDKFPDIKKPKIAIVSLTSCEGCQFALIDLGEKFSEAMEKVEVVDFRLLKDEKDETKLLDIAFVEGSPMTKANKETLLEIRKRSNLLVVIGNCAAMGGVPEIKNYREQKQTAKHVYKYIQGIENEPIQEVDNFVKVDFTFPGCPYGEALVISTKEAIEKIKGVTEAEVEVVFEPQWTPKMMTDEAKSKSNLPAEYLFDM